MVDTDNPLFPSATGRGRGRPDTKLGSGRVTGYGEAGRGGGDGRDVDGVCGPAVGVAATAPRPSPNASIELMETPSTGRPGEGVGEAMSLKWQWKVWGEPSLPDTCP